LDHEVPIQEQRSQQLEKFPTRLSRQGCLFWVPPLIAFFVDEDVGHGNRILDELGCSFVDQALTIFRLGLRCPAEYLSS
jgi:hypothetical protein